LLLATAQFFSGCAWIERVFFGKGPQGKGGVHEVYLAPNGSAYDLITPNGIHVRTNGQYKSEPVRHAAADAMDRYWRDLERCALDVIGPGDRVIAEKLLPEFPHHLSIEIASDWKMIQGPVTHRSLQAFPSLTNFGQWVTASREEDALYVKVVPELNGLGRQMAGELNLWLSGHTSNLPTDFSNRCTNLPCHRFSYDNSPSQAWADCS